LFICFLGRVRNPLHFAIKRHLRSFKLLISAAVSIHDSQPYNRTGQTTWELVHHRRQASNHCCRHNGNGSTAL